jgi:hypothetical protein
VSSPEPLLPRLKLISPSDNVACPVGVHQRSELGQVVLLQQGLRGQGAEKDIDWYQSDQDRSVTKQSATDFDR